MGVSTDAIVAFGFNLGEELPESLLATLDADEESWDFEYWVAARLGVADLEWPERRKAVDAFPFEIITHCSYDYPMYFLAASDTTQRARRGYPEALAMKEASPEQVQAMRDFCGEFEIEWEDPRWHLFSLWG